MKSYKDYLSMQGISTVQLSKKIDFTRSYLCNVFNGKSRASKKLAKILSDFSNGSFSIQDIFDLYDSEKGGLPKLSVSAKTKRKS